MTSKEAKHIALTMTASVIEEHMGEAGFLYDSSDADRDKVMKEIDKITDALRKRSEKLKAN